MTIQILENVPLAPLTTMRVGGNARFFVRIKSVEELQEAVLFAQKSNISFFVLGCGSNTLFSDDGFSGLVIKNEIKGISYDTLNYKTAFPPVAFACQSRPNPAKMTTGTPFCNSGYDNNFVTAGAGELWDGFVDDIVSHNLWGIENLSLIPGTVGGAVVQNIGAYGVEACDTIFSVEAFDVNTMQIKTFLQGECEFSYRKSIFKKNSNLIVICVKFKLNNESSPNIEYEDTKNYFIDVNNSAPSIVEIREAIIKIRNAKMPSPPLGTAGSFFKNPVVSRIRYEELKKEFPELKAYLQGDNTAKLSAGWLLDKVGGWKGVRQGDAGVYEKQALVLVNYGTATTNEILSLADEIKKDIKQKTNIEIENEVVVVGK